MKNKRQWKFCRIAERQAKTVNKNHYKPIGELVSSDPVVDSETPIVAPTVLLEVPKPKLVPPSDVTAISISVDVNEIVVTARFNV